GLMAAEVVHDDNVARRENREKNLLDISAEACAIDRSVDDAGRGEPVATQRRKEGQGRHRPKGALATRRSSGASAMGARHVGFRPGLVVEDKPPRIDRRLPQTALWGRSIHGCKPKVPTRHHTILPRTTRAQEA